MWTGNILHSAVCAFIMLVPLVLSGVRAAETCISPGASGELSLNEILDTLYGLENLDRIEDDFDTFWRNHIRDYGGGERQINVRASCTGNQLAFGYIAKEYGRDVFNEVLTVEGGQNFIVENAGVGIGPLKYAGRLPDQVPPIFRFAVDPEEAGKPRVSSLPSDNDGGADHMVSYLLKNGDGAGAIIIAWEDELDFDRDFNDLVIEIQEVSPAQRTPNLGQQELERILTGKYKSMDNLERINDLEDEYWINEEGSLPTPILVHSSSQTSITLGVISGVGEFLDYSNPEAAIPLFRWGDDRQGQVTSQTAYKTVIGDDVDYIYRRDRMLTWRIKNDDNKYVIAWDTGSIIGAGNYANYVYEVSGVAPAKLVNDRVSLSGVNARKNSCGGVDIRATFSSESIIYNPFIVVQRLELVDDSVPNRVPNRQPTLILYNADGFSGMACDRGVGVGSTLTGGLPRVTFRIADESGIDLQSFRFFVDLFEGGEKWTPSLTQ